MRPGRVVAATSVNRGRSSRIERAVGPLPSTTSRLKSSSAGYSTSSTGRGIRWISSTNSTSPSSRFVRIAARSLGRSSAGPDVGWNPAPISPATIDASVVLPRPGGPENSRWSTGSPRARAPSISSASCSFTRSCPTNSPSVLGRSARSRSRSSSVSATGSIRRSASGTTTGSSASPVIPAPPPGAPRGAGPRSRGRRPRGRRGPRRPPAARARAPAAPPAPPRAGPSPRCSSPSPPSRSRRSSTTRWATFLPTPGTTVSAPGRRRRRLGAAQWARASTGTRGRPSDRRPSRP